MKSTIVSLLVIFSFLALSLSAQENKVDTTRLGVPSLSLPPFRSQSLRLDTTKFRLPVDFGLAKPKGLTLSDSLIMDRKWDHLSYIRKSTPKAPILPFYITPDLDVNIGVSHWEVPLIGLTTTFAPTMTYSPFERLSFFGGVAFTQFPNLSYVQNMIDPNWLVKSNMITQGFIGGAYVLHDRITLRGTYQRSLYNQMPANLIIFAPPFQMATFGADIELWRGLGVSVERVWEIDRSGRMNSGMRYSPYVNVNKFMKSLKGN